MSWIKRPNSMTNSKTQSCQEKVVPRGTVLILEWIPVWQLSMEIPEVSKLVEQWWECNKLLLHIIHHYRMHKLKAEPIILKSNLTIREDLISRRQRSKCSPKRHEHNDSNKGIVRHFYSMNWPVIFLIIANLLINKVCKKIHFIISVFSFTV
jgi:hypothetical protein